MLRCLNTTHDIAKAWSNKPVMWSLYSDDGYHFLASFSPGIHPNILPAIYKMFDFLTYSFLFSSVRCIMHHLTFWSP